MVDSLITLFEQYRDIAIVLSTLINIIISILAFVPSVFLTAANIYFFGFWEGTLISLLGETVGAAVSFLIFRKGGRGLAQDKLGKDPRVRRLLEVKGSEAFFLILSLRLMPLIPSGLITLSAAVGAMSFFIFIVSSSLGKIPALLMEAYSVHEVMNWTFQGKVLLGLIGLVILVLVLRKLKKG